MNKACLVALAIALMGTAGHAQIPIKKNPNANQKTAIARAGDEYWCIADFMMTTNDDCAMEILAGYFFIGWMLDKGKVKVSEFLPRETAATIDPEVANIQGQRHRTYGGITTIVLHSKDFSAGDAHFVGNDAGFTTPGVGRGYDLLLASTLLHESKRFYGPRYTTHGGGMFKTPADATKKVCQDKNAWCAEDKIFSRAKLKFFADLTFSKADFKFVCDRAEEAGKQIKALCTKAKK